MTLTENERYHLKKVIKELDSYSARHTEFVTVYIPAGYELVKIRPVDMFPNTPHIECVSLFVRD